MFDEGTYQRIEALFSYSAIQVRGGWPALPADAKLTAKINGPTVALLRQYLVISDDLAPEQEQGDAYDAAVIEAVERFQARHGLEATGNVDAKTLKAMNVPVGERIKQLEASLERLLGMDFVLPNATWWSTFRPRLSRRSATIRWNAATASSSAKSTSRRRR